MAKFKNINSSSGKFYFDGMRYEFNEVFETEDKNLISFLGSNSNWQRLDTPKADNKPATKTAVKNDDNF